jgi:flavin reductase (DIM6/NTAB) family NADH-FMN oxidoreductase RutF
MLFYEPHARDARLRHDPFKAIVAPRPIGWISTIDRDGSVNLAPYSFFNAIGEGPPMLAFSSSGAKDSATYAAQTGEFVWNLATWELREAMNATSALLPRGSSEFARAGLELAPCRLVAPPRVATSPCAMECKVVHHAQLHDVHGRPAQQYLFVGQVVGVHLAEEAIGDDGTVRTAALHPVARCGGVADYAVVTQTFEMFRPTA